jgi:hypothetical protein
MHKFILGGINERCRLCFYALLENILVGRQLIFSKGVLIPLFSYGSYIAFI